MKIFTIYQVHQAKYESAKLIHSCYDIDQNKDRINVEQFVDTAK